MSQLLKLDDLLVYNEQGELDGTGDYVRLEDVKALLAGVPYSTTARRDFAHDALFGMPGVPNETGCLIILDEGLPTERFQHPHSEATYQVWLRGYNSKALRVRDELSKLAKAEAAYYVDHIEMSNLLSEWWALEFIPRRPGDQ